MDPNVSYFVHPAYFAAVNGKTKEIKVCNSYGVWRSTSFATYKDLENDAFGVSQKQLIKFLKIKLNADAKKNFTLNPFDITKKVNLNEVLKTILKKSKFIP